MNESEFNELLARYEKGKCTLLEKQLIEKWLDSPNLKRQNAFKDETERIKVKNALRQAIYSSAGVPAKRGKQIYASFLLKIAASILLIATASYGVFTYSSYREELKYVNTETQSGNEIKKVLLSDGSVVWLKPASSLTYPKKFRDKGDRTLVLKGEALFEVEKNPTQPFIVNSGELTTTVLGTSFNIKATSDQVEVVVLSGKVSLTSATNKKGVVVLPDERAVYNGSNKELAKVEALVEQPDAEAITNGTEYVMNFNDTRMDEVVRRIEGKFNVKVRMSDPGMENCLITADFTGQSLIKTLNIISKALSVKYEENNNGITLIGKACLPNSNEQGAEM
ncbi:MAG TPA: FecR family protein [Chryseolinea sp.]|nr:FecR family protein [Chryseolinea sp.]